MTPAALRASRVQFLALGGFMGAWGAHVPSLKSAHALSDGQLGAVLLCAALGSAAMLPFTAPLVHRLGPRQMARVSASVIAGAMALLLHAPGMVPLALLAAALGAGASLLDVSVNAEAVLIEERLGRPCLIGLHAMFSVGGMAAAGAVALLLRAAVSPGAQLLLLPALLWAAMAWACGAMLSQPGHGSAEHARWQWPRGRLLALGLLAGAGFLAEGAMYDWSVVLMRDVMQAPPDIAALGYAAFAGAMAAARFGGDWLRQRWPAHRLLAAHGLLAAVAMAAVLTMQSPWPALLGLALVGLGLANIAPLIYRVASQQPGVTPAAGISAVVAVSFIGFVGGPPLIGALAEAWGLRLALVAVVLAALALVPGARAAR
ncbi:MFS transporter [Ideonella alba]|uniref:MFS transporter n=1 Tax=Ideonella alba TaxID=2824118 RepID=A0A940YH37_9BURK|nr:MFS transporter [Ideonella alba]MBQ0933236.1 MFS transporter [Ideonella alba]